jgi:hypothetical protein
VKQWCFPHDSIKPSWALSSEQYIKEAIKNIGQALAQDNRVLKKNKQPFSTDYYPELDDTALLGDEKNELLSKSNKYSQMDGRTGQIRHLCPYCSSLIIFGTTPTWSS